MGGVKFMEAILFLDAEGFLFEWKTKRRIEIKRRSLCGHINRYYIPEAPVPPLHSCRGGLLWTVDGLFLL